MKDCDHESGTQAWTKHLHRYKNKLKNVVYPAPVHSVGFIIAATLLINSFGHKSESDVVSKISLHVPGNATLKQVIGCCVFGTGVWLILVLIARYTLRLMLAYKGWIYEERGSGSKISWQTKLWLFVLKALTVHKPLLFSFQGCMSRQPVPSLHGTMKKYLRSIRPIKKDDEYECIVKLAEDFENGIGKKLHRYLVIKSWWSANYVTDWWEKYAYLKGRSPLLINSNYYCIDAIFLNPTSLQSARAAGIVHEILQFRSLIERQELKPIMLQGTIPLCSSQYGRLFNTTRLPGVEMDNIIHYSDSNHIVVYHHGRYYKVIVCHRGRILTRCEIEIQLTQILEDKSSPVDGEEKLAALTAWDRTSWAKAREEFFFEGINRQSLDAIEKAAFVVALDDFDYEFDFKHPQKLSHWGQVLLYGNGHDRWFDKSFTICVSKNGRIGVNGEHSWGDGAIMSHLWEHILIEETFAADTPNAWYGPNGHTRGAPHYKLSPIRLKWDFPQDCLLAIDKADLVAQALINDCDLQIYAHDAYGKGFMKECRISPDAYIQMALQLAYYRDVGKFSLTYEAALARLFRDGRTETVRSCTVESSAWVKAMMDSKCSVEECLSLFRKAGAVHTSLYQEAMCGGGIDRHLFCLYVMSKYMQVDSPFLNEVLQEPWLLSTSQTPHGQTGKVDMKKNPQFVSPCGGFGPVTDNGYGVSYIISGEDMVFFHIASKPSCPHTDSTRFGAQIGQALADIKSMFSEVKSNQKKQS